MRKILYCWLSLGLVISFIGIFCWTSNMTELSATGSSSVLPVMKDYSTSFAKKNKILVDVTSGGSGKGLSDAVHENADLGNMSSNKENDILTNANNKKAWTNNNSRTITLNKDAIAMVVHLPKNLASLNKNHDFTIDATALAHLYQGHKISWAQLITNSWAQNDTDNNIVPMGRTGGSAASGTSEAFFNGLSKLSQVKFSVEDKNHDHNNIVTTNESNSQALNKLNNITGGITYLSLGYSLSNSSSTALVAQIDGFPSASATKKVVMVATINNAQNGTYQWVRPFNTAFSFNNTKNIKYILEFLTFILNDQLTNKLQSIVAKDGFVNLTTQEINDQLITLQQHYSDIALYNAKNPTNPLFKYHQYAFGINT